MIKEIKQDLKKEKFRLNFISNIFIYISIISNNFTVKIYALLKSHIQSYCLFILLLKNKHPRLFQLNVYKNLKVKI